MNLNTINNAIHASGGILYLMAIMLLIALTVIIEREWYLRTTRKQGEKVIAELEGSTQLESSTLKLLEEKYPHLPHAMILKVALNHDLAHDFDRLPDKLDESIMKTLPKVDRNLWILDTVVTMAPLIGLLGTIIGMFHAFDVLGSTGGPPTQITGGVAQALVATASGLFIAILGLFFFNSLNNRARSIIHQMETVKLMLLNRVYPHYHSQEKEVSTAKVRLAA